MNNRIILVLAIFGLLAWPWQTTSIAAAQITPPASGTPATTSPVTPPAASPGGFQAPKARTQRPGWGSNRVGAGAIGRPGNAAIPAKPPTVAPLPKKTEPVPQPAPPAAPAAATTAVPPAVPEPSPGPTEPNAPVQTPPGAAAPAAVDTPKPDAGVSPAIPKPAPATSKPTGKAAAFHEQYKEFFVDSDFTPEFTSYWQTTIEAEPDRLAEIVQESAAFAAEAVAAGVAQSPMRVDSVSNGLGWLETLYYGVDDTGWRDVGAAISAAFGETPAPFTTLLDTGGAPAETRTAMQTCMTLALFGDQFSLRQWIALPQRCSAFLDGAQAFLFGGGALAPEQVDSLGSLFQSVPREVHQVLAVIVPEGVQMDAATAALSTPGMVLNIYASVTGYTAPDEFFSELGNQPVAPAFTIEAALQLVRAAQYVQFSMRPELQQRRDLILRNAGAEPTRYLRRAYPPGTYQSDPDELLPQTAYLWFIDSITAFQQAGGLLRFYENEPMDAVLLLADVLSGGGDATLAFRTGLDGKVSSKLAGIQRVEVFPGVAFTNGINIGGQYWSFGIDSTGGVTRESAPVAIEEPVEGEGASF